MAMQTCRTRYYSVLVRHRRRKHLSVGHWQIASSLDSQIVPQREQGFKTTLVGDYPDVENTAFWFSKIELISKFGIRGVAVSRGVSGASPRAKETGERGRS